MRQIVTGLSTGYGNKAMILTEFEIGMIVSRIHVKNEQYLSISNSSNIMASFPYPVLSPAAILPSQPIFDNLPDPRAFGIFWYPNFQRKNRNLYIIPSSFGKNMLFSSAV
jgi:hypothetical protein